MLQTLWKSIKVSSLFGAGAFALAIPGHLLSSANYGDIVQYYNMVNAATVRDPVAGQFYVIDQQGTIKDSLCVLRNDDFEAQTPAEPDRRLVNRLGNAIPVAFEAVSIFVPTLKADGGAEQTERSRYTLNLRDIQRRSAPSSSLLEQNRRILASRDLDRMEKDISSARFGEELRLESCATAIVSNLEAGLFVCQLNDIVRLGTHGPILGVDFAALCLARSTDTKPTTFPELDRGPLLSRVKHWLGLLEVEFILQESNADTT
jgi:hypothetical protein